MKSDAIRRMRAVETLLDRCRQHRVPVWLDGATLAHAVPHGGPDPALGTVELGVMAGDHARVTNLVTGIGAAHEAIRVVPYALDGDACIRASDTNPIAHPIADIHPLGEMFFLGHRVHVPAAVSRVLARVHRVAVTSRALVQSPLSVTVREAATIAEGLRDRDTPFVVRGCAREFPDRQRTLAALARETQVYGYFTSEREQFEYATLPPAELMAGWCAEAMRFNVVDAVCSDPTLTPQVIAENHTPAPGYTGSLGYLCCYVVTNRNARTGFHTDPPPGGGWMYLYEGQKLWWMLPPDALSVNDPPDRTLAAIRDMDFTDLVHAFDGRLRGRVSVAFCEADDFVYFPEGWAHAVRTYDRAFGISGYV